MENTLELLKRAHEGDKAARDILAEANLGLVWSIVRRFANRGVEQEDLFQIGSIGLLKAIDKFDFQYDVKFSTYAVPMITGEIKRFLRDDGMIKVSRGMKETAAKAYMAREELEKKTGREPSLEEIAEVLEISKEELVLAMESGTEVESLQKTIYQGDGTDITLMDKIEEQKNQQEVLLNQLLLEEMIKTLDEKEKKLIYMRYFRDKTQSAIAGEMGMTQVQVSRMEKRILNNLRKML